MWHSRVAAASNYLHTWVCTLPNLPYLTYPLPQHSPTKPTLIYLSTTLPYLSKPTIPSYQTYPTLPPSTIPSYQTNPTLLPPTTPSYQTHPTLRPPTIPSYQTNPTLPPPQYPPTKPTLLHPLHNTLLPNQPYSTYLSPTISLYTTYPTLHPHTTALSVLDSSVKRTDWEGPGFKSWSSTVGGL